MIRCLTQLGPKSNINAKDIRALTVGDRDALLMHLRILTSGSKIQPVISCPNIDCAETMEFEFNIKDFLVPPNPDAKEIFETQISTNGTSFEVKFRLPTVEDQEAAAKLPPKKQENASMVLLKRCITEIRKNGSIIPPPINLPDPLVESLSQQVAQLDPQAEIILNLTCPSCQHYFRTYFDIGDYFFKEIMAGSKQLFREIHVLALYYHWSEKEILNMTKPRRQIYLDLLMATLNPGEN